MKYTREAFFAHCRRVWRLDWPELQKPPVTNDPCDPLMLCLRGPPPMPPVPPPAPPRPRDRRYTVDVNIQEKPMPEITDKALEKLIERSKRLDRIEDSLIQLKKRTNRHLNSGGAEPPQACLAAIVNDLLATLDHLVGPIDHPTSAAPHLDNEAHD